jgi:hypothetical protein
MNPLSSNHPLVVRPYKKLRRLGGGGPPPTPITCTTPPPAPGLPKITLNIGVKPKINGTIDQNGDNLLDVLSPPGFGWNGDEYDYFLELGMHNGGILTQPRIGTAFVAYDCSTDILCVAAYLSDTAIFGLSPNCKIVQSSSSSWVSIKIDSENSNIIKYKEEGPNTTAFEYVLFPDDDFPGGLRPIGT